MADPTIQTFCCHRTESASDPVHNLMNEFNKKGFIIISIITSIIGISGSVYQIFIRKNDQEATTPRSLIGRRIIIFLAYSDLFASIGVFIRSGTWNFFEKSIPYSNDNSSVLFCSITSAFVQLFYTATWLWTFIYAYNMKCALQNKTIRIRDLHFIVWSLSFLFTAVGTMSLYYPDAECHDIEDPVTVVWRIMPNYFVNYAPILFVMIANPIIYFQCSKEVDKQLIRSFGQYTNNERQIHDLFKIKFSLINVIFYVCWLPNILNAILVWTMWAQLSTKMSAMGKAVVYIWYVIAILNPLQAFFNALVYRKWNDKVFGCCWIKDCITKWLEERRGVNYTTYVMTESTPLLQGTSSSNIERIEENTIETQEDDEKFYRFSIQCPLV